MTAVLVTVATPVFAQVTVDLHALQALPDRPPASRPGRPAPSFVAPKAPAVARREPLPTPPVPPSAPSTAQSTLPPVPPVAHAAPPASAERPAPQPALPETVPQTATIAPIAPAPSPLSAQPPPPPTSDNAGTVAAPTRSGLRLSFAPGQSDLSSESSASIKQLAKAAPSGDETTFNVLAYAAGKADDPSTARRISLSRAMAVRGALVADGVPSVRIFVRALGTRYGDGPPDRVDIGVVGANALPDTATAR